jgi:hypothetical protein
MTGTRGRSIRQMVATVNASSTVPPPSPTRKGRPIGTRLVHPDDIEIRWLSLEVAQFATRAVERMGSIASLSRLTRVHVTTISRMLDGELVNLRVMGLIANRLGIKFKLVESEKQ